MPSAKQGAFSWQRARQRAAVVTGRCAAGGMRTCSQTTKTVTEAVLQGAQIKPLIENKESAFDLIVKMWAAYTAEKTAPESGIEISDNLIQRPLEAQEVQAYLGLFGGNAISHQTLLEELQSGHALSQEIDIEEELERIAEEKKRAAEEAMAQMEAMGGLGGPEDYAPKPAAAVHKEAEKSVNPKKEAEKQAGKKTAKPA